MKKIISSVVVICMILALCVSLCSCDAAKIKDFQKDSLDALQAAYANTSLGVKAADTGFEKIAEQALKDGSLAILFESDTLLGENNYVNEIIYFDDDGSSIVSETKVKFGEYDLSALIFSKDNELTVSSEDVFGTNQAFFVKLDTLLEDIKGSTLAEMLGLTDDVLDSVIPMIPEDLLTGDALKMPTEQEKEEYVNKIVEILAFEVSEGKAKDMSGNDVDCIVVSYKLNTEKVKAIIETTTECFPDLLNYFSFSSTSAPMEATIDDDSASGVITTDIEDMIDELLETMDIDFKQTINVSKKENKVVSDSIDLTLTVTEYGESETLTLTCASLYSDTKTTTTAELALPEEASAKAEVVAEKNAEGVLSYKASAEIFDGNDKEGGATFEFTYKDSAKTFNASLSIEDVDAETMTFGLAGELNVTKTYASVTLSEVSYGDVALKLHLELGFAKEATAPTLPTDRKNILDMTESDFESVLNSFAESKLAQLINEYFAN